MANVRCVRCGNAIGGGFLCDACQADSVPQPLRRTNDGLASPIAPRWFDPYALAMAAAVVMLGCIAFLEWPKLQRSMEDKAASAGSPTKPYAYEDAGGRGQRETTTELPVAQGRSTPAPPVPGQLERPLPTSPQSASMLQLAADSSSLMGSTEKAAQQTLDAFLNEYCSTRAGQIGQPVKTTTVTWWPFGAGVIVELNEGGAYRQGTAQYAPRRGWAWMISPDSLASNN